MWFGVEDYCIDFLQFQWMGIDNGGFARYYAITWIKARISTCVGECGKAGLFLANSAHKTTALEVPID